MAKKKRRSTAYQLERQQYWQRMITQWRQSGLSQAVFCRRHKLQAQPFSKWKVRLAKSSKATTKLTSPSDFIEIKPAVPHRCTYEIITPCAYRIRVEEGYRPEVVLDLLSLVRRSC